MSAWIFLMAAARTRAAPAVSSSLRAGSEIRIASSAPIARACLSASRADSGPMHRAGTVLALLASFCCSAPSTAYSSNGLMTSGASPHETFPPSALTFASESGTCLIQAMIFKRLLLDGISSLRGGRFSRRHFGMHDLLSKSSAGEQSQLLLVRLLRADGHYPRNDGNY